MLAAEGRTRSLASFLKAATERNAPGTPIGRAMQLKPEWLQVRFLLWVLFEFVLVEQPEVLACLSRKRTQAPDRADILNIGGFSDAVFNVVSSFLESDPSRFVQEVEAVEL